MNPSHWFDLHGRRAIVTGASRGIGRAIAHALESAGAHVAILSRNAPNAPTSEFIHVPADFNNLEEIPEAVDTAITALGGLDILVNNVGGWGPAPLDSLSQRSFERAFSFNVSSALLVTKSAVPTLQQSPYAAIVNVSSAAARLVAGGFAAYGTSKAALNRLTQEMAIELAPTIRVNAIEPGTVLTAALEVVLDTEEAQDRIARTIPLQRIGAPEDIAAAALFLASDASSYMTGAILPVDGGTRSPINVLE